MSDVFRNLNKQAIRTEINPMDKSTVVSVYPKEIIEIKPTIEPGVFKVPAGSPEKPSILVVGTSSWWREVNPDEPLLEIPVSSISVARSIVQDYANGLIACNQTDRMPGLFFVSGECSLAEIQTKHALLLKSAIQKQRNWFQALVQMADVLWSRSNGNPLSISDDARIAARELNLNNKAWQQDMHMIEQVKCVACGNLRNPAFPICGTCKAIVDPVLAKSLNLTFAGA